MLNVQIRSLQSISRTLQECKSVQFVAPCKALGPVLNVMCRCHLFAIVIFSDKNEKNCDCSLGCSDNNIKPSYVNERSFLVISKISMKTAFSQLRAEKVKLK